MRDSAALHASSLSAPRLVGLLLATTATHIVAPPMSSREPVVVALSGTRTARDLLDDVDLRSCDWPPPGEGETGDGRDGGIGQTAARGGRVHRGFAQRTLRLWRDDATLRRACTGYRARKRGVVLCGWSLGGGTCVCLAAMLHAQYGTPIVAVRTFGAPNAGNPAFAKWYADAGLGQRTIRYEVPCDPVAGLLREPTFAPVGTRVLVPCASRGGVLAQHDLRLYRQGVLDLEDGGRPEEAVWLC